MTMSVVTCCHNSESRICSFLMNLDASLKSCGTEKVEVIIVNNASTDGTEKSIRELLPELLAASYLLIEEPLLGLVNARKAGVLASKGEIICFLDDDNLVTAEYFSHVRYVFESHPSVGFFGCSTILPEHVSLSSDIKPFLKAYAVGDLYCENGLIRAWEGVWGAGLAVRAIPMKQLFLSDFEPVLVGRRGAVQLAGDDTEICYAFSILGWQGWYQCRALIIHAINPARFSQSKLIEMYRGFGAASVVLTRYAWYLKGRKIMATRLYSILFALKVLKNFISILVFMSFHAGTLHSKIRWAFFSESLKAFVNGSAKENAQMKNIKLLACLGASSKTDLSPAR